MIMKKQKLSESLWTLCIGLSTVTIIYGVRNQVMPIWFFSSMILIYVVYGVRIYG